MFSCDVCRKAFACNLSVIEGFESQHNGFPYTVCPYIRVTDTVHAQMAENNTQFDNTAVTTK